MSFYHRGFKVSANQVVPFPSVTFLTYFPSPSHTHKPHNVPLYTPLGPRQGFPLPFFSLSLFLIPILCPSLVSYPPIHNNFLNCLFSLRITSQDRTSSFPLTLLFGSFPLFLLLLLLSSRLPDRGSALLVPTLPGGPPTPAQAVVWPFRYRKNVSLPAAHRTFSSSWLRPNGGSGGGGGGILAAAAEPEHAKGKGWKLTPG